MNNISLCDLSLIIYEQYEQSIIYKTSTTNNTNDTNNLLLFRDTRVFELSERLTSWAA